MPVPSAADIRRRLSAFAKEWASAHSEAAEAKTFWLRALGGRLKSDYRYSASIVYNNFPWPDPSEAQRAAIDAAGQAILDARAGYPDATLADVYDPLTIGHVGRTAQGPSGQRPRGRRRLRLQGDRADAPCVAFLFGLYQQRTSLLPAAQDQSGR